ncbi:MAG: hypothetical protein V8R80_02655, partial [Eubacterium sp.]
SLDLTIPESLIEIIANRPEIICGKTETAFFAVQEDAVPPASHPCRLSKMRATPQPETICMEREFLWQ